MGTSYNHLSAAERTTLMVMLAEGLPPSTVARHLGRSRSTISRELGRNRSGAGDIQEPYDAIVADDRARSLRAAPGLNPKLGVAYKLNTRPRKILGFRMPLEVYGRQMAEL